MKGRQIGGGGGEKKSRQRGILGKKKVFVLKRIVNEEGPSHKRD